MKKITIIIFSVFFIYACSNSTKKSEIRKDAEITKNKLDTIGLSDTKINKTISNKPKTDTISVSNIVNDKNTKKSKSVELQTVIKKTNNKTKKVFNKKDIDTKNNIIDGEKDMFKADVNVVQRVTADKLIKNEASTIKIEKTVKPEKVTPIVDESKHTFVKKKNKINGDWSFKQEGNKTYLIFYGNFKTKKGSDLEIFLTKKNMDQVTSKNALEASIFLENLKSNSGEQKYLIPSNIDLSQYKSIIIHCKKYTILWGGSNF